MDALSLYKQLIREGVLLRLDGNYIIWEAPEDGCLSFIQEEAMREGKVELIRMIDPRPDLDTDSEEWQVALQGAMRQDACLWGLLHGLRCAGTKIHNDGGRYRLDCREVEVPDLREKWLMPNRSGIQFALNEIPLQGPIGEYAGNLS